jgi:hypothetical protein
MESRSTVCLPRATLRRSGLSGLLAARCLLPQRAIAGRTLRTGSTASVMPCLTVRITPGPGPRSASCHRLGLPQVHLTTPRTRLNLTTLQCGAMALGAAAAIVRSPMTATACVVPTAFSQLLARFHKKKTSFPLLRKLYNTLWSFAYFSVFGIHLPLSFSFLSTDVTLRLCIAGFSTAFHLHGSRLRLQGMQIRVNTISVRHTTE